MSTRAQARTCKANRKDAKAAPGNGTAAAAAAPVVPAPVPIAAGGWGGAVGAPAPGDAPHYYCLANRTMCHTHVAGCWYAAVCPEALPEPAAAAPTTVVRGDNVSWDGRPLPAWLEL